MLNKPANMSRRGFLRLLGITSVAVAVPGLLVTPPKQLVVPATSIVVPRINAVWYMDIRQILSDNSIKDIVTEEDIRTLAAARDAADSARLRGSLPLVC